MEAAGAYIRTLRDLAGLSRTALARKARTHESQLVRIEKGDQDSGFSLVVRVVRALGGSVEVVADLIDSGVSVEEGKEAARQARDRERAQQIATRIINAAGGDIDRAITVLEELRAEETEQPGTLDFIEALLRAQRDRRAGR